MVKKKTTCDLSNVLKILDIKVPDDAAFILFISHVNHTDPIKSAE